MAAAFEPNGGRYFEEGVIKGHAGSGRGGEKFETSIYVMGRRLLLTLWLWIVAAALTSSLC